MSAARNPVAIKICGTTSLHDAQLAVDAGAQALGFVFAPSKRQVTAAQIAAITPLLPRKLEKVGVFTSTDAHAIEQIARNVGLTAVQLHSAYRPELHRALRSGFGPDVRILQVISVPVDCDQVAGAALRREILQVVQSTADILLDTSIGHVSGGTGMAFSWERAAAVLAEIPRANMRLGLAGGLTAENVAGAIRILQPDFVDVVSGVEAGPGRKDANRLRSFIQAVRAVRA